MSAQTVCPRCGKPFEVDPPRICQSCIDGALQHCDRSREHLDLARLHIEQDCFFDHIAQAVNEQSLAINFPEGYS